MGVHRLEHAPSGGCCYRGFCAPRRPIFPRLHGDNGRGLLGVLLHHVGLLHHLARLHRKLQDTNTEVRRRLRRWGGAVREEGRGLLT